MLVYNHDVASLVKRLRRFSVEMHKSVSSNVSSMSEADKGRLASYLGSAKAFKSWVISQPELDLPESSPAAQELGDTPLFSEPENLDIDMIQQLMRNLEIELVNSQSARMPANLTVHDAGRFDVIVTKVENFLNDFVENQNLDLPESSPRESMTGQGQLGV